VQLVDLAADRDGLTFPGARERADLQRIPGQPALQVHGPKRLPGLPHAQLDGLRLRGDPQAARLGRGPAAQPLDLHVLIRARIHDLAANQADLRDADRQGSHVDAVGDGGDDEGSGRVAGRLDLDPDSDILQDGGECDLSAPQAADGDAHAAMAELQERRGPQAVDVGAQEPGVQLDPVEGDRPAQRRGQRRLDALAREAFPVAVGEEPAAQPDRQDEQPGGGQDGEQDAAATQHGGWGVGG
jgi:hypothetical protein